MRTWINLFERQLIEGVTETLFRRHGGTVMPFADLPASAQKAIRHYMTVDGDRHDYDQSRYGFLMIPADTLKKLCWNAPDNSMRDEYDNWDEYHAEYWSGENEGDYADHLQQMWPVLICDEEGILDGWHRFHWYLRNGVKKIPAIVFVDDEKAVGPSWEDMTPAERWASL